MDYTAVLLDPIYDGLGVAASLTPNRAGAAPAPVTVLDKTATIEVSEQFDIHTVRPAATVRVRDLTDAGVAVGEVDGGTLEFNGRVWRIDSHRMKPTPDGEASGEMLMWLTDESRYA